MNPRDDPTPILRVENLCKTYVQASESKKETQIRAVVNVNFSVSEGETFGLVGETGSGKSTVARMLLGLEPPTSGSVFVDGIDITALSNSEVRELRKRIQIVLQDPIAALNRRKTVEQIISAPMKVHGMGDAAFRTRRVQELLTLVGLSSSYSTSKRGELSGGECQRVAIARALSIEPSILVLDESVSALDVSIRAQILNLLKDLQGRLGLTYVFISHDLLVVRYMAERIAVMREGSVVEIGSRDEIFNQPQHPYTIALMTATPTLELGS